jgi:hypothetical protein
MTTRTRLLFALPALGFAVTALVLATGAFASGDAPQSRAIPQGDAAAMKPSDLSPNATSRDWQEMAGSGTKRGLK